MTTTNLSDFGYRELAMLEEILKAMREQGLPDNFSDNEVVPMMNQNSGNVFLTNSDYEVAMMNGDTLEMFYTLPYNGNEGFVEDLIQQYKNDDIDREDFEYLADILESECEDDDLIEEIRNKIEE